MRSFQISGVLGGLKSDFLADKFRLVRLGDRVFAVRNGTGYLLRPGVSFNDVFRADLQAMIENEIRDAVEVVDDVDRYLMARAALIEACCGERTVAVGIGVNTITSNRARVGETSCAPGAYQRVFDESIKSVPGRPEIFPIGCWENGGGHGGVIGKRWDSTTTKPEPEFGRVFGPNGDGIGWTICDDMTACDVEAQTPLYLHDAKFYLHSWGIGPCILVTTDVLPDEERMVLEVVRGGQIIADGSFRFGDYGHKGGETIKKWVLPGRHWEFKHGGGIASLGAGYVPAGGVEVGDIIRMKNLCGVFEQQVVAISPAD